MFGSPDFSAVLVLLGLFGAVLLALLSYQRPGRGLVTLGWGLLVLATAVALLLGAFGRPGVGPAIVLLLVLVAVMALLLTYQNPAWAHVVFWIGVLLFLLALPFLTVNRGDLALFCLIAGPGLLMLVAVLFPEVPARYSRLGVTDAPEALSAAELSTERQRYTRLATGITLVSIAGVWLFGGVPRAPVGTVEAQPVTFDAALAARGAPLFTEYGCNACHSVTGAGRRRPHPAERLQPPGAPQRRLGHPGRRGLHPGVDPPIPTPTWSTASPAGRCSPPSRGACRRSPSRPTSTPWWSTSSRSPPAPAGAGAATTPAPAAESAGRRRTGRGSPPGTPLRPPLRGALSARRAHRCPQRDSPYLHGAGADWALVRVANTHGEKRVFSSGGYAPRPPSGEALKEIARVYALSDTRFCSRTGRALNKRFALAGGVLLALGAGGAAAAQSVETAAVACGAAVAKPVPVSGMATLSVSPADFEARQQKLNQALASKLGISVERLTQATAEARKEAGLPEGGSVTARGLPPGRRSSPWKAIP